MDTSNFASTFAPYTPPPDDPSALRTSPSSQPSTFTKIKRPWFPVHDPMQASASYQSGAVPTFGSSISGGIGAVAEIDTPSQIWETRFGWRVDVCSAVTYLGGPVTALFFLILETSNDYIRFHAYQSALLTTPLLILRIFASFIFPPWLLTMLTLLLFAVTIAMGIRAYRDATQSGLARYELPYVGVMAERWVGEE